MVEDVEFLLAVFFSGCCGDLIELPLLMYCGAIFCFSCIMIVNGFYVCMHACIMYVPREALASALANMWSTRCCWQVSR